MKTKLFIGVVLVLLGTNLFTYMTTRYTTTRHVLTRARERMDAALKNEGLYEQVFYPSDRAQSVPLMLAIREAGGQYYWWNDGLLYWGTAGLLIIMGILVSFVRPRRRCAA